MGMWEIIFDGVASPDAFKEKLEKCVFFKKCDEPKAAVIDDRKVTLSFSSPVSRNDLLKKCTQTFSKYGSFTSHAVADKSAPAVSTGSSSEGALGQVVGEPGAGVRAPAAEGTLALRSGVEEIKRAAKGLSATECHSLAVHFGLLYLSSTHAVTQFSAVTKLLNLKNLAAQAFAQPADTWNRLLTDFTSKRVDHLYKVCACNCGCRARSGCTRICDRCGKYCCAHCQPVQLGDVTCPIRPRCVRGRDRFERFTYELNRGPPSWSNRALGPYIALDHWSDKGWQELCHVCAGKDKLLTVDLCPTNPVDGLMWYFNAPWLEDYTQNCNGNPRPNRLCSPNRTTELDPKLLDIKEVYQTEPLKNTTRKVRPPDWESSFKVRAVLGGANGSHIEVDINLFCFLMNPVWAKHHIVKNIRDEWLQNPENHKYWGPILRLPEPPPSPARSLGGPIPTIEEIEDDEASGEEGPRPKRLRCASDDERESTEEEQETSSEDGAASEKCDLEDLELSAEEQETIQKIIDQGPGARNAFNDWSKETALAKYVLKVWLECDPRLYKAWKEWSRLCKRASMSNNDEKRYGEFMRNHKWPTGSSSSNPAHATHALT